MYVVAKLAQWYQDWVLRFQVFTEFGRRTQQEKQQAMKMLLLQDMQRLCGTVFGGMMWSVKNFSSFPPLLHNMSNYLAIWYG
jgi:chemotaxis regulatin CheY-phosphate phosphatase CheZ